MDSSMLFARQLGEGIMKVIYINEGILWQPDMGLWRFYLNYGTLDPSDSTYVIATGLECIIEHNIEDITACHKELVDEGADNPVSFCRYALQAVPAYFPNGYDHEAMLCYCAMIAGVCRLCHRNRQNGILDSAADVFCMVISAFILTKEFSLETYDQLAEMAYTIAKAVDDEIEEVSVHTVEGNMFFQSDCSDVPRERLIDC